MKQSQNNNFDQFIKGKLENASVEPPAFLWEKIEKQLPSTAPWYSKKKNLLLLLMISFFATSDIFIHQNNQLFSFKSKVNISNNTKPSLNNVDFIDNTRSTEKDKSSNNTENSLSTTAVASTFYDNNNDGIKSSTTSIETKNKPASELEKRNKRITRLSSTDYISNTEKKAKTKSTSTKTKQSSDNSSQANIEPTELNIEKKSTKKSKQQNKNKTNDIIISDNSINSTSKQKDSTATEIEIDKKIKRNKNIKEKPLFALNKKNTSTTNRKNKKRNDITNKNNDVSKNSLTTNNSVNTAAEIEPIQEPIRSKQTEEMTASILPLKLNTTPLNSIDVLRSLIEPTKLEALDFEASAGVEDLNPNKEKLMRNLKQFAGYNINQGFHVGAFIGINNNWLTNKSFSGSENTTNLKPKVYFGKAYGLNIGYDYSDRFGIQLEAQYAEQGQKYTETTLFGNQNKDIVLNYLKLPIYMKYKYSFINGYNSKPIVMNFLFGTNFGVLLKQDVLVNNKSILFEKHYSKYEGGLNVGLDVDLYMTRYMYLTIGARTGFGTSFKKGVPLSYQIGVTTQFNFRIPKKLK